MKSESRIDLPEAFLKSVKDQLGKDGLKQYINCFEESSLRWAHSIPNKVLPDWLTSDYSVVPSSLAVSTDPLWQAGSYYCQELSASLPIRAFMENISKGKKFSKILDVCAAPGGKSLQLMELVGDNGLLISNEIISSRCKILMENLERASAWRSSVTNLDIEDIAKYCPETFDLILVDAPCSGEGMFRKDSATIAQWTPEMVEICAGRQNRILTHALKCLTGDGYLIYSTCTFNTKENEETVAKLLESENLELLHSSKVWPQDDLGEGHYYAFLQKNGREKRVKPKVVKQKKHKLPEPLSHLIDSVAELSWMRRCGEIINKNDHWYWCSYNLPKLKYRRQGLELGEYKRGFKKSDFKFSQALALSLKYSWVKDSSVWSINLCDKKIKAYLSGKELENVDGFTGYGLVCYKGQGLGWAKAIGSYLRNLFPLAWRLK